MCLPFFAHHPHKHGQETKPQLLPGVFHVDVSYERNPLIHSYSWETFVLTKNLRQKWVSLRLGFLKLVVELWSNLAPWTRHLISQIGSSCQVGFIFFENHHVGILHDSVFLSNSNLFKELLLPSTKATKEGLHLGKLKQEMCPEFSIAWGSGLEDEISFWDGLGFKEGMPFSHNTWRPPAMLQRHLHPTHPRVARRSCCKPSSRPYVACIRREAIHSSFSWFILQGWTLHVPPKPSPPRIWNTWISDAWRWCLKTL